MFNRRKIYNQIKFKILRKWPICLVGLFFVVAGFLAGIYTANAFSDTTKALIMQRLMNVGEGSTFFGRLLRLEWYRFISCFIIGVFSLYPILLPFSILALTFAAALWSIGWGCIFASISKLKTLLCLPFLFVLVLLHCMTFLYFFYRMTAYLRKLIFERRIPKSSRDVLYESASHIIDCYKWFIFSAVASLIEAFILPIFYS